MLSVKRLTMTFERSVAVLKKGNIVIATALLGGILYELIIKILNTKYYEDQTSEPKAGNDVPPDGEETAKVDGSVVNCPDQLKSSFFLFRLMQFDRRVQRYQDWQSKGTDGKTKEDIRRVHQSSYGFLKKSTYLYATH